MRDQISGAEREDPLAPFPAAMHILEDLSRLRVRIILGVLPPRKGREFTTYFGAPLGRFELPLVMPFQVLA